MPLFGPPDIEQLRAKGDVRGLVKALRQDKYGKVRSAAAEALGQIGDSQALEPLVAALADQDKDLARAAAEALGMLRDPRAAGALIAALSDDKLDMAAGDALSELGAGALDPLIAALGDAEVSVRRGAASALGSIGDRRALEPLIAALADDDVGVRNDAARALGAIGGRQAVPALIAMLPNAAAADALGKIGGPRAVASLKTVLTDPERIHRESAAIALGRIHSPHAVDALVDALGEHTEVSGIAARILAKRGSRAVEPLIAALSDPDNRRRALAAETLGRIRDGRALEPLATALRDPDAGVVVVAAAALDSLGFRPSDTETAAAYFVARREWAKCVRLGAPAAERLVAALEDRERSVRRHAADALQALGWQPDDTVAGAAYWAARREWDKCVDIGPAAVRPLTVALRDPIWEVREAAASALEALGWQPDDTVAGAAYWAEKGEWDKCVEIGPAAVEPLIAELTQEGSNRRRGAATALVSIWRSGKLGPAERKLLLSSRDAITTPHFDDYGQGRCGDDTYDYHEDEGIGVDFPL